ncbi:MAG: Rab family GTPase [Candidatus Hodarchaeales archaeon]|jgi:small GTP-binding protein
MNENHVKPKYHIKIIVCGGGAVGKTSLIRRYVENKFNHNYLMTVGMDPSNRVIEIDDIPVNLLLYDVAGQKRFEIMRDIFFRGAHAGLLVFDISRSEETINELVSWKNQIDERVGEIPLILVGNKVDIKDQTIFDRDNFDDEIIPWIKPMKYMETSALKDENVNQLFEEITRAVLNRQGIL